MLVPHLINFEIMISRNNDSACPRLNYHIRLSFVIIVHCRGTMVEGKSRSSLGKFKTTTRLGGYPALGNPHKIVQPEGGVSGGRGGAGRGGRKLVAGRKCTE